MNIYILDQNTLTIGDLDFSPIEKLGKVTCLDSMGAKEVILACKDADILLINKQEISREMMEQLPNLKYIGVFATGYNNVDIKAARELGIDVVNVPGYSTDAVAQLAFSFIFAYTTSLQAYNQAVHEGKWVYSPTFAFFPYHLSELTGKVLGIVGFGNIAKKVAKIGDAIGMQIKIYSRRKYDDCPYEQVEKEELFQTSDFLTLHCPLNEGTANLVNEETLKLMKKTAFLVNTSRGGVVDSKALAEALNEERIAGAGIDVLVNEPMDKDEPLYTAKNCMITPHIGWACSETRARLVLLVADNLSSWMNGTPKNVVN
ncbi:MAG: D-2-hydroxyacid dehydrogenase [Lachnospiraceae bacterium]|nr:D-2-hydroxyacid dehydrogenase [Lachnospiraceae bacterium]